MWCNNVINVSTVCLLFVIPSFFFILFQAPLWFLSISPINHHLTIVPDCWITPRSKLFSYLCVYSSFPLSRCRSPFLFCHHNSTDPHFSFSSPSLRFFYTFLYLFFWVFSLSMLFLLLSRFSLFHYFYFSSFFLLLLLIFPLPVSVMHQVSAWIKSRMMSLMSALFILFDVKSNNNTALVNNCKSFGSSNYKPWQYKHIVFANFLI